MQYDFNMTFNATLQHQFELQKCGTEAVPKPRVLGLKKVGMNG